MRWHIIFLIFKLVRERCLIRLSAGKLKELIAEVDHETDAVSSRFSGKSLTLKWLLGLCAM